MQIRQLQGAERFEAGKISLIAFHGRADDLEKLREESEKSTVEDWGAFGDDGKLMARVINNRFQANLRGAVVENGGIGAVSTLPEYRESGAVREIFGSLLPQAWRNGEVISTLYPFLHGFYRKFGYETVCFRNDFTFKPAALRGRRFEGWARQWNEGDPLDEYASLYERFARDYELSIVRTEERMKGHFSGSFHKERRFRYLLGDDTGPVAYVLFQDVFQPDAARLKVEEAVWRDRSGFGAILGFLARFTADYGEITLPLPTGVDLRVYADDPYSVSVSPQCTYMIRIINMEKALSLLDAPEGGAVIRVSGDGQIPENNGTWRVAGHAAAPTEAEPDLCVSQRAMAQLLCGAVSLREALLRDDVAVNGNRYALERLFSRRSIYVGDHF